MNKLRELVENFRAVMVQSIPSDFKGTSLSVSKFPGACCDDSSLILAAYLADNGYPQARVMRGEYGGNSSELNSHVWLKFDCKNIDITADQFNKYGYNNAPVIIEETNGFLSTFEVEDDGIADFREHLKSYSDASLETDFQACYEVVLVKMSTLA